jgi:hypothetical protein
MALALQIPTQNTQVKQVYQTCNIYKLNSIFMSVPGSSKQSLPLTCEMWFINQVNREYFFLEIVIFLQNNKFLHIH